MTDLGQYRVTGTREYRGHKPGDVFEQNSPYGAEQRAIARGDIELLRRVEATLQPGSFRLPDGWNNERTERSR